MKKLLSCLYLALLILTKPTLAQDNSDLFELNFYGPFFHSGVLPNALFLIGDIKPDDSFHLRKALRSHSVDIIVLNSAGGSVWEGLSMAGVINDKGLNTYVPAASTCASACSFMFFGGKIRVSEGKLGVHQFYSNKANQSSTIGASQQGAQFTVSEIIGFLNEFGTPPFVFEKMFEAKTMYFFNVNETEAIQNYQRSANSLDTKETNAIKKLLDDLLRHYETVGSSKTLGDATPLKDVDKVQQPSVKPVEPTPTQEAQPSKPKAGKEILQKEALLFIQTKLADVGCDPGPIDGLWGRQTEKAAIRFASLAGLPTSQSELLSPEFVNKLASAPSNFCPPAIKRDKRYKNIKVDGEWTLAADCNDRITDGILLFSNPRLRDKDGAVKYAVKYHHSTGRTRKGYAHHFPERSDFYTDLEVVVSFGLGFEILQFKMSGDAFKGFRLRNNLYDCSLSLTR